MLRIRTPDVEMWDNVNCEFINLEGVELEMEHSLYTISKWESKWHKSFLMSKLNAEETLDYIKIMTVTQNVDPLIFATLTDENIEEIHKYITAPMTATTFSEVPGGRRKTEIITAELIYYWMIALNIPFECQYWHFNRLMTLIRVCSIKNAPPKKMSKNDIRRQNAALNAARLKQFNTNG